MLVGNDCLVHGTVSRGGSERRARVGAQTGGRVLRGGAAQEARGAGRGGRSSKRGQGRVERASLWLTGLAPVSSLRALGRSSPSALLRAAAMPSTTRFAALTSRGDRRVFCRARRFA